MKFYLYTFFVISFLFLSSCKLEAEGIVYGKEQCHYCKMNIVDRNHASQYVTKKGKQYKFDAIECMVNALKDNNQIPAILLVSDFDSSTMIAAESASFLISPEIQSPMGANLSAFLLLERAEEMKTKHRGRVYSWIELQSKIEKQTK